MGPGPTAGAAAGEVADLTDIPTLSSQEQHPVPVTLVHFLFL